MPLVNYGLGGGHTYTYEHNDFGKMKGISRKQAAGAPGLKTIKIRLILLTIHM